MSNRTFTYLTPKARAAAFSCARGQYQCSLLDDGQSWSGSDLTGAAKKYSSKYHSSRQELLGRLAAHPLLSVTETKGHRVRRIVVIMTKAERRRVVDGQIVEAADAIIDKAAKAVEATRRKALRDAAREAREYASDLPSLLTLTAA